MCTDYDVKEDAFRNFGCLIDSQSQLIVQHKWKYLKLANDKPFRNYTVYFVWIHPDGKQITLDNEIRLSGNSIKNTKVNSFHFKAQLARPIQPGIWRLLLISNSEIKFSKFMKSTESATKSSIKSSNVSSILNVKLSNSTTFRSINASTAKSTTAISSKLNATTSSIDKLNEILNDILNEASFQSKVIAETRFLVLDSNSRLITSSSRTYAKLIEQLKPFWKINDICLDELTLKDQKLIGTSFNECRLTIKNCLNTTWSSRLPDPKSQFVN